MVSESDVQVLQDQFMNGLPDQLKVTRIDDLHSGLSLIPFEGTEGEYYKNWFDRSKNPDAMEFLHKSTPYITDAGKSVSVAEFIEFVVRSPSDVYYRIQHPTHGFVGHIGLDCIDYKEMSGWLGIFLANKDFWGYGIATNSTTLILDYLRKKQFKRIMASTDINHGASQAVLKKFFNVTETIDGSIFYEKFL